MLKALENISAFYANPTRFMALARQVHRPLWALAIGVLAYGLYRVAYVPADYQQGDSVRIMFVHVPAAWMSLFGYSFIFIASVTALIFRHPLGHVAARAAAPVGAVFTLLALITGSLWGQPMWGTWWVWDPRLTSFLILFLFYLGYIALWHAIDNPDKAADLTSMLCLVGSVFALLSRYAVNFWNQGLHQGASLSLDKEEHVADVFYVPLVITIGGFVLLFFALVLLRTGTEIRLRRMSVLMNRERMT